MRGFCGVHRGIKKRSRTGLTCSVCRTAVELGGGRLYRGIKGKVRRVVIVKIGVGIERGDGQAHMKIVSGGI